MNYLATTTRAGPGLNFNFFIAATLNSYVNRLTNEKTLTFKNRQSHFDGHKSFPLSGSRPKCCEVSAAFQGFGKVIAVRQHELRQQDPPNYRLRPNATEKNEHFVPH